MWNDDIPAAFRYQPTDYVFKFLLKYSHTVPKDGLMPIYVFNSLGYPRPLWYFETTPLQNAEDYIAWFVDIGMRLKAATAGEENGLSIGITNLLWNQTAQERSSIVYYYNAALKKIARILQGFDVGSADPPLRLRALKNYSVITSRAANFLSAATGLNLEPMRVIINDIKKSGLVEQNNIFPRVQNIAKRFQLQGKDV